MDGTEQAVATLTSMGLPGVCIVGLAWALARVHKLYTESQEARIAEGIGCVEKLSAAVATLEKVRPQ